MSYLGGCILCVKVVLSVYVVCNVYFKYDVHLNKYNVQKSVRQCLDKIGETIVKELEMRSRTVNRIQTKKQNKK